ncbi:crosslink repair DNA glycosylase YcaQ family protein [Nesterenkonia sp.]|uniref:DNA glycosylase AlkZ-like family protein n=1 Tax=Nesterenkonia sp. TaxID=704201 RepID=UPI00261910F8|nr:crosslink repair DNA glycosylase YcaQ family protein [Nesterenkonia sp.]
MTADTIPVTQEWVRAAVVSAQRIPDPSGPGEYSTAADVLRSAGLIQLDPLMRVSTAQRLTCLTRLPRQHRADDVDASLWPQKSPVSFEAFTKVACLFPMQDWPLLELRRQYFRERARQRYAGTLTPALRSQIREVVGAQPRGVQIGTIEKALGSARTTGWNWSEVKQAAEYMVRTGELVITARDGVVRLFDLPERALPAAVREAEHDPPDALRARLAQRAAAHLGVMTAADFAHHYHLSRPDAEQGIALAQLAQLTVPGWKETAYCLPELLDAPMPEDHGLGEARTARLIGPFDPLLRDRGRARRIFGFDYTFEAYVPRSKRIYGHYVMALLSGHRLIGRVDLQRAGGLLQVNTVFPEPGVPTRSVTARVKTAGRTLARQLGVELSLPS